MWLVLWSLSRFPLNCETPYATFKRHFSQMICPLLSHSLLLQLAWGFFFCLSIQVFTLARLFFSPFFHFYLFHPSPPTYKPPFITAQRPLCSSLCRTCCPLSRSCPGSLQSALLPHSPHVPPVLPQTAIMCLSAAQHAAEWRLFSIPPAIYLTLSSTQVEQRHRARSSHVCDGRTAVLPAGPPKQPFSGSISHTGDGKHIYLVCL